MWISRKEYDRLNDRLEKVEDTLRMLSHCLDDIIVPTTEPHTHYWRDGFSSKDIVTMPFRDVVQALAKAHLKATPPCNKKASLV